VDGLERILLSLLDGEYTRHPFYGSRRMARYLCGLGHAVDRKRVRRLTQKLGLAGMSPGPDTSKPHPQHKVYPYLPRAWALSAPTRGGAPTSPTSGCPHGFVYLVAIIDWYGRTNSRRFRRGLGWRLSNTMDAGFCVGCLEEAIKAYGVTVCRKPSTPAKARSSPAAASRGRCSTTASPSAWADICSCNSCIPRIPVGYGRGRALDNIFVERLLRTVKYEDAYLQKYANMPDLLLGLTGYFQFYNGERLHQALGYATPNTVYRTATGGGAKIVDKFSNARETSPSAEELGQRHQAVLWTGLYLKLGRYLSGQWGGTLPSKRFSAKADKPVLAWLIK
jgi:putative transposase